MRIRILSPSDGNANAYMWGDYWVKKDLEAEFTRRGYSMVNGEADLDFCLFGAYQPVRRATAPRKFCWVYSHPRLVTDDLSKYFEHVFVLSNKFQLKVEGSTVLYGASSKAFVPRQTDAEYDIVFMGNAGKPKRKEILDYLCRLEKYRILLIGDWATMSRFKGTDHGGMYVDNRKFSQLFNRGLLSIYSAHEDMRVEGFVAVRILDIFRSSENLCISDDNVGLGDMFSNIPTFGDKNELVSLIDWYLQHPNGIRNTASWCRKDAEQWTFGRVVDEIERWI